MIGALLMAAAVASAWQAPAEPACVAVAEPAPPPSLLAPPNPRGLTRAAVTVRPFLGLLAGSWGGLGEARVEHYFRAPLMLGLALSPLAVASDGQGPGAIAHVRAHAAFVTDFLTVGLGAGARLQRFGRSGLSIAPALRLGSLDGLNLSVEYSYASTPNQLTGKRTVGLSNLLVAAAVPITRRLAIVSDSGVSLIDLWAYTSLGLRHRLRGDGGPGTWLASAAVGAALVVDRAPCDYDATVPCGSSARSFGPTISVGLERRF